MHAPPPTPAHGAAFDPRSMMSPSMQAAMPLSPAYPMTPPNTPAVAARYQQAVTPPAVPLAGPLGNSEARVQPPAAAVALKTPTPAKSDRSPPRTTVPAAPATMRAWVIRSPADVGDEGRFHFEQSWPVTAPKAGEIRVKVVCAALNPVDFKRATAFGDPTGKSAALGATLAFPAVLGCDGSGFVESVGPGVTGFQNGDRVAFHNSVFKAHGTFAEYTICDAAAVSLIPDSVSFAAAAAVPCAGYTAFVGLFDKLRVAPGSSVLIVGAAGGVGNYAVSLAKLAGCRVAATCSAGSAEYVKGLGADAVFDRNLPPGQLTDKIQREFGAVDAVFDAVGALADGPTLAMCCQAVVFGGHLASVGPVSSAGAESRLFTKQLSLHHVLLGGLHGDAATKPVLASIGDSVLGLMGTGVEGRRLPSHVTELIKVSQVRQGLVTLQQGATRGKIVMSFVPPGIANAEQS